MLDGSKINAEVERALSESVTKQLLQPFHSAVAMEAYSLRDRRVAQAFRVTFADKLCPISILKSERYIQSLLVSTQRKYNPLSLAKKSNVIELLMCHHVVNIVRSELDINYMSFPMNLRTRIFIRLVVQRKFAAWTSL